MVYFRANGWSKFFHEKFEYSSSIPRFINLLNYSFLLILISLVLLIKFKKKKNLKIP